MHAIVSRECSFLHELIAVFLSSVMITLRRLCSGLCIKFYDDLSGVLANCPIS